MPLGLFDKRKQHQHPVASTSTASQEKDLRGTQFKVGRHSVTVERKLAEGGFAIVFLVRCNRTNRLFALKRQFVNDKLQLEACKREIRIIESLSDHKNIVSYVDSSIHEVEDGVFECMLLTEYYKRNVLSLINDRIVSRQTLKLGEILKIFCDMCEAVSRLHHSQTPVLHRDLKVENILMDEKQGVFVLCDFGSATTKILSTQTHPHSRVEEEILKFTTLSYRAPEMIDLYAGKSITTKADIWALGVMLFKLCYFGLPFEESALAIQNGTFTFPSRPHIPPELRALIRYLLEANMEKRPDIFQTASVAFRLTNRHCPVPNLHDVKVPSTEDLLAVLYSHEERSTDRSKSASPSLSFDKSPLEVPNSVSDAGGNAGLAQGTTVAPRERPRGKNLANLQQTSASTDTRQRGVTPLAEQHSVPRDEAISCFSAPAVSHFFSFLVMCGRDFAVTKAQKNSKCLQAEVPISASTPDINGQHQYHDHQQQYVQQRSSKEGTPSRSSTLSSSSEAVSAPATTTTTTAAPMGRPTDLGFTDLEEPSYPNPFMVTSPFHTVEPPEGPLVSLSPPDADNTRTQESMITEGGAPSQSEPHLHAHGRHDAVARPTAQQLTGHRRNFSDTTAVFGEQGRPSAFKPYDRTSQPDGLDGGMAPSAKERDRAAPPAERAQSAAQRPPRNPFEAAPGFGVAGASAAATQLRGFRKPSMDDARFGKEFDNLPRRGSFSSTSNVKSSESLIMIIDEKDPFGAAPFKPPSSVQVRRFVIQRKLSIHVRKVLRSEQQDLSGSRASSTVSTSGQRRGSKASGASSIRPPLPPTSSATGNNMPPPAHPPPEVVSYPKAPEVSVVEDAGANVTSSADSALLLTLASSIKQTTTVASNRYRKLVDTDDELDATASTDRPSDQLDRLKPPAGLDQDDKDSIGSASDLLHIVTSTTDESGHSEHSDTEEDLPTAMAAGVAPAKSSPRAIAGTATEASESLCTSAIGSRITYEHFADAHSSDSRGAAHSHDSSMDGSDRERMVRLATRRSSSASSSAGGGTTEREPRHAARRASAADADSELSESNFHPYFMNSTDHSDGLAHRALLDDDELADKHLSHPESLQLHVMHKPDATDVSLPTSGRKQSREEQDALWSPESGDTLCAVALAPLAPPTTVETVNFRIVNTTNQSDETAKLQPNDPSKVVSRPTAAILSTLATVDMEHRRLPPSTLPIGGDRQPVAPKQTESMQVTRVIVNASPSIPTAPQSIQFLNGNSESEVSKAPLTDVPRVPMRQMTTTSTQAQHAHHHHQPLSVQQTVPAQLKQIPMTPPSRSPVCISVAKPPQPPAAAASPAHKPLPQQYSPRTVIRVEHQRTPTKDVPIKQGSVQTSTPAMAQPLVGQSASDNDDDDIFSNKSSAKKTKKKNKKKGRGFVDDGGEDELVLSSSSSHFASVSKSHHQAALVSPVSAGHIPAVPKRKSKKDKSDKTQKKSVESAFVNTSFQFEDHDCGGAR